LDESTQLREIDMPNMKRNALRTLALAAALATGFTALPAKAEEVYLIRGFANVFSRGVDQMAAQLRARGVNAKSYSNGQWSSIARDIVARARQDRVSYPIVIAGHSVGGQEASQFSNYLSKAGVPVALVVGIDPGFAPPAPFSAGAPRVVNFWIAGSARGNPYRSTAGFSGQIQNIDIKSFSRADHVGIDKDPAVQARIVGLIASVVGK
jgi:pimeloyl-ACP methyl ester carboxylesterase